ncbi:hypothetical protein [Flavobacterium sp. HSC-61S13]|uniref:hypothetical protein n=1 Tax=Flavobacterium sp. HSC-61S13 TaxID=2910963 RepID=UPI00209D5824|nr:hypothetical protein [Flavobacterium sp. HSC-61S13]MCP1996617.1 hypothetical protein [Flavobacterium sp. HSC-61S13]
MSVTKEIKKEEVFNLDLFRVESIKEIQGKKELQLQIVKDNPYIVITGNETFTEAKKNRTNLVTARTSLVKEKASVIKKIKEVITIPVGQTYDHLIEITKPHEEKQQLEVDRWENIKEAERKEKLRKEQERKDKHLSNIRSIVSFNTEKIKNLTYESSLTFEVKAILDDIEVSYEIFEEFGTTLLSELEALKFTLSTRKDTLKEQEEIRLEKLKLAKERLEQNRIQKIKDSITEFYTTWTVAFSKMTFAQIADTKENFLAVAIHCEEFQPEFAEKRALLVKDFEAREVVLKEQEKQRLDLEKQKEQQAKIAAKNKLAQDKIDAGNKAKQDKLDASQAILDTQKKELKIEKDNLLKEQRILVLKEIGFDDDLALDLPHLKIIFPEEDLLTTDEEFKDFILDLRYKILNPPTPTMEVDYEEPALNETQEESKLFLESFCDFCINNHGTISKEYIVEFLKQ